MSTWNVAGWTEQNGDLRRAILEHDGLKSDIFCIQETHLSNNDKNQPSLEGYRWIGHCRTLKHVKANRTHGGVGVFINETLYQTYTISVLDASYDGLLALLFKYKISGYCFSLYCCYLPPENSPHGRDSIAFYTHLLSLIYLHSYVDCSFVCGDINSRISNRQDAISSLDDIPEREILDTHLNKHGEAFLDFLIEARMAVTNGRVQGRNEFTTFSARGKAVVDYFALPHENIANCISCDVYPVSEIATDSSVHSLISERSKLSDHSPVKLIYRINSYSDLNSPDPSYTDNNSLHKKYKYNTMSPEFLKSETWIAILDSLLNRLTDIDPLQSQVDVFYEDMLSEIFKEMDQYIQYKQVSSNTRKRLKTHKPFWNDELTTAWKTMANAEKLIRKNKNNSMNTILRSEFRLKQKQFDKLLRQTERKYNRQKAAEIEEINTSNPTEFWKQINSLGPKKSKKIPMEVYNSNSSEKIHDTELVLNSWRCEFETLYNIPESEHDTSECDFYDNIMSSIHNIKHVELSNFDANNAEYNQPFNNTEIDKVCTLLKTAKAVGPDMIPNEVLKHVGLRRLLLKFLNSCFLNNIIPTVWRKAVITPIPKSSTKDPCVPLNYRGISLLSCIYKLYSSLLNVRITKHCEENGYIVDEQNGFRSKRSCQDHIYVLSAIIRNRKVTGQSTFCAYIDFRKAFDWVNRDLLLYKLATSFDIHGRLFNTLSTIYASSNSQLRLNSYLTTSFNVTSGVRQGDTMSPILFSMFLNDLATGIKDLDCGVTINEHNLSILLYADDIVLIAPNEEKLQKMLDFVSKWCQKWRMAVNTDKTKVVHFRQRSHLKTMFDFYLGSELLEKVSEYKYLGVLFDEYLDFEHNASLLADAAGRALGAIRTKLKYLKECGFKSFNTLFQSGVLSISDYSAGVWGTKKFNKIEQVSYRGARYYLGVHRFASTNALLGDLGWVTARTRHKILILKLWNRLCEMPFNRLTKKVFNWDLLYGSRKGTWSNTAKHILQEIGCPELFDNTNPCDIGHANTALNIIDENDWDTSRYNSDKLRYYNLYKYSKDTEDYLKYNIKRYHRSLFAQFRCGILPLQIEVGRYRNISLCDRICPICKCAVEDEIHFLCQCPCYSDVREVLFRKAHREHSEFMNIDVIDQFVFIMSNLQREVIKFLAIAVERRTAMLTCEN